jgi:hypothetical protein
VSFFSKKSIKKAKLSREKCRDEGNEKKTKKLRRRLDV